MGQAWSPSSIPLDTSYPGTSGTRLSRLLDLIRGYRRLVWIEFRRCGGYWMLPLILPLVWYMNRYQVDYGVVLWHKMSIVTFQSYVIIAPLTAGLTAWLAGRDRRRRTDGLVEAAPLRLFHRDLVLIGASAGWGLVAYALVGMWFMGRGVLVSFLGVVAACSLFWWLGEWGERDELRQAGLVQAIPALIASIIGMSVWSPFGEPERAGARSLPRIRSLHLAVLVVPALIIAGLLVSLWKPLTPDVDLVNVVVRNVVGLIGVALLCGRVIDARLTWIGPLMWLAFTLIGPLLLPLNGGKGFELWRSPWWAWIAQSDASRSGWVIASPLGVAGAVVMCRFGPRDAVGEEE